MAPQIPKDRTIAALTEVWASIADLLEHIDESEWSTPSPLPGWDVRDNVAHIIGTEKMLMGEQPPDAEIDAPHVRNDIAMLNERWVESLRDASADEIRSEFASITERRLATLAELSDEQWNEEGFTPAGRNIYGRFMQIRVFDCWLHEQDIRDAIGRPGHETGLAVSVTLDELTTAMGFVVGKRAGIESGNSVTFALTDGGHVVREIHVDVGERAAVVDRLDRPATTTLTMPIGVMTRRSAGRVAPDELLDQIAIDGDAEIAQKILRNQAYTI